MKRRLASERHAPPAPVFGSRLLAALIVVAVPIGISACDRETDAPEQAPRVPLGEAMRQDQRPLQAAPAPADPAQQPADPAVAPVAPNVPDEKIESFASAFEKVKVINAEYAPRINAADSPEEAQKAQLAASEQMASVVKEAGLTIDEYSRIAHLMRTDARIREKVEENTEGGGS